MLLFFEFLFLQLNQSGPGRKWSQSHVENSSFRVVGMDGH
jgi:hypothetical protein